MFYKDEILRYVLSDYYDYEFLCKLGRRLFFDMKLSSRDEAFLRDMKVVMKQFKVDSLFYKFINSCKDTYSSNCFGCIEIARHGDDSLVLTITEPLTEENYGSNVKVVVAYNKDWRTREFWSKQLESTRWFVRLKKDCTTDRFLLDEYRYILQKLSIDKNGCSPLTTMVVPGTLPPQCSITDYGSPTNDTREWLMNRVSEVVSKAYKSRDDIDKLKLLLIMTSNLDPLVERYMLFLFARAL